MVVAHSPDTLQLRVAIPSSYFYADDSDRLISYYNGETGEASFAYDEIGNPTTYRGKTATWENGRQLRSYSYQDNNNVLQTITFAYDARGRRIRKGNISFTYDSDGNLIRQSDGLEFLYDHTGVFAVKYNNATYYYRKDAQGNVIALLDNSGAIVVKYAYDAWGNCKALNANGVEITDTAHIGYLNPFRYRGYYYDVETKLYFLKTRYYDPEIGRFLTIDDVSYLDPDSINGLNLYAYCGNNPVMGVDPTGNAWWNWVISGLQVVVGTVLIATGVGAGFGAALVVSGALGLVANAAGPRIAQAIGGGGSVANGFGAISTGISLLAYGPIGIIAGIGLMAVGAATIAVGANDIVAGLTGTNYLQKWTGMSDATYGWLDLGLNIASAVGSLIGRLTMRTISTYSSTESTQSTAKPYACETNGYKETHYNGRGKMSWSQHNTVHGKSSNPHWHIEIPHSQHYYSYWAMILRLAIKELFKR